MGRGQLDCLLVEFDAMGAGRVPSSMMALGASYLTVLAEELTVGLIQDYSAGSVVLLASALESELSQLNAEVLNCGLPILGICNGAQVIASHLGGKVRRMSSPEIGHVLYRRHSYGLLERRWPPGSTVYMHHGYEISEMPAHVRVLGGTEGSKVASFEYLGGIAPLFGVQFHPEEQPGSFGLALLYRFIRLARRKSRAFYPS